MIITYSFFVFVFYCLKLIVHFSDHTRPAKFGICLWLLLLIIVLWILLVSGIVCAREVFDL